MPDEADVSQTVDKPSTLQNLIVKHRDSEDSEWPANHTEEIQFPELIRTEFLMEVTFAEIAFDLDYCMLEAQEVGSDDSDSFAMSTSDSGTESEEDSDKENRSRKRNAKSAQPKSSTCHICHKSFTSSYHLKHHIEAFHAKLTRFSCTFCDKKFYDNFNLQNHIRNVHLRVKVIKVKTPDPNKPFKCETCGKFYKSPTTLKQHQRRYHRVLLPAAGKKFERSRRLNC
jgi:uncharacterized C2H2 Zn-finger protein